MDTCVPPVCATTDWQCVDQQLQQCLADRTGWMNFGPPCEQNEICDPVGHECDQCVEPEFQCVAPETLQSCDAQGHWMTQEICIEPQVCNANAQMCVGGP
jgi:hypothetical protein